VPNLASPRTVFRWLGLAALLPLLNCVGDTSGTTLYVYDNTSSTVRVWSDVNNVYDAATAGTTVAAPDRVITSSLYSSITLAWGGLARDDNRDRLYLVSQAGTVFDIHNAGSQDGTISATSDITYFTLGASTERYSSGSVFGAASIDPTSDILYVLETALDGTACRVWVISGASSQANAGALTPASSYTSGIDTDTYGSGVAAIPGSGVFGLFGGGGAIYTASSTFTGPRLRLAPGGSFVSTDSTGYGYDVIIGGDTLLGSSATYGSLGFDASNSCVYVLAGPGPTGIQVFTRSQYTSHALDEAPVRTLGDSAASLADLRILAHAPYSDWLLGAEYAATTSGTGIGTGLPTLFIWKAPADGGTAVQAAMPESSSGTLQIRGMAIGTSD